MFIFTLSDSVQRIFTFITTCKFNSIIGSLNVDFYSVYKHVHISPNGHHWPRPFVTLALPHLAY